MEHLHPMGHL
jgi:hypothetical protein